MCVCVCVYIVVDDMLFGWISGCASVFYGYCSQYYFLHKYKTKLYNCVKEME